MSQTRDIISEIRNGVLEALEHGEDVVTFRNELCGEYMRTCRRVFDENFEIAELLARRDIDNKRRNP